MTIHIDRPRPAARDRRGGEPGRPLTLAARFGRLVSRGLSRWVDGVRRFAWPVVLAAVLSCVAAGYYAATHLAVHTDIAAMLSPELPYRKNFLAFQEAFPQYDDNIVIVVEGNTPDQADDAAEKLAATLGSQTGLFKTVFYPAGHPFFRRNGLLYIGVDELEDLADRLADAQPLISRLAEDMSLRGLFDLLDEAAENVATGEKDPAPLVRVFRMIGDTVAARLDGRDARLSWRDLMAGEDSGASDRRAIIITQPTVDYATLRPGSTAIATIRQAARDLGLTGTHGVRVRLTGGVPLREEELQSVRGSVGLAGVISLLLVSALAFIGLRSPRLVLGTVAALVIGLTWTAAAAAVTVGHLNLLSVTFAVLFIGLAIDFSIQFGLRYREGVDGGLGHAEALRQAAANTGVAVTLAALCAALGFFAFVPTAYLGLSELGIIAGTGMAIGLFSAMTVLPAILSLMPLKPGSPLLERRSGAALGTFVHRHARAIVLGAAAAGLVALTALPALRFDFDPIHLKDPDTESVQTYLDLTQEASTSPYSAKVVTASLDAAAALAERLEKLTVVDQALTLRSFVPEDQEEKLGIIESMALFLLPALQVAQPKPPPTPAERQEATERFQRRLEALSDSPNAGVLAEPARRLGALLGRFVARAGADAAAYSALEGALISTLPGRLERLREGLEAEPVSLGDLPDDLRARFVAPDGRALVQIMPAERLTDPAALHRFVARISEVAPKSTGHPVLLAKGGDTVIGAFETAGALAIASIAVVLLIVLRSLRDTLLVLSPLVLAALLTGAIMVLAGIPLNFANIIALPLLFGLGVAFGIYLVLRHREVAHVGELFRTSTPRAVLFSALTTMASFGSLMVSSHRGTAGMGELLAVSLTLALACTLVVLPALLAWRARRRAARAGGP
ncbi:MAG: MMPL family transporter [Kiloniellaceae bacterium]